MKMKIILLSIPSLDKKGALVGNIDTVLCDMWCKKTCSVFSIISKIGIGPRNQMTKVNTLEETPEDRDQDGVYRKIKDKYLNSFPIYLVVLDMYMDMFLDSGNVLCILEYL